jgi:DNA processing protein
VTAWTLKDPHYPLRLRHIDDPPIVLYVKGEIGIEHLTHTIGVVGTRQATQYGKRLAEETAKGLSEHGVTVVSGLAAGIDSCAHMGAIKGGTPTIAVLGCGPDVCYPPSNQGLFDTIVKEGKGVTISEYFPGTQPEKFRFPARNRIISGLSEAVVVVEGGLDSGSLITAYQAFDQNRSVFAFPGRVDSPMAAGPHKLIRDTRAQLCTSYEDVLDDLGWVKTKAGPVERERPAVVQLYGREREIYDLISTEPIHFDVLCEKSGMDAGEMSATLTMLELAGLILRETGDWYLRNR